MRAHTIIQINNLSRFELTHTQMHNKSAAFYEKSHTSQKKFFPVDSKKQREPRLIVMGICCTSSKLAKCGIMCLPTPTNVILTASLQKKKNKTSEHKTSGAKQENITKEKRKKQENLSKNNKKQC